MTFRADDTKSAKLGNALSQHDIRTTPRHVGGYSHSPFLACHGYDFSLFLMIFGIKNRVGNPPFFQFMAKVFRHVNGDGADKDRLSSFIKFGNIIHDRFKFFFFGFIDHIRKIMPDHGLVGGNHRNIQIVYFFELSRLGISRTGHACKFIIHSKIILKGYRGKGLIFVFYFNVFLGLKRLVKAFAVAPSWHKATGEFIHNDDFTFLDDIVNIPLEQSVGL